MLWFVVSASHPDSCKQVLYCSGISDTSPWFYKKKSYCKTEMLTLCVLHQCEEEHPSEFLEICPSNL